MSSTDLAAWVQAYGSIVAIIGAALIAILQSRAQHNSSLRVMKAEHELLRTELAQTVLAISIGCKKVMDHVAAQLPDRDAVHLVAQGDRHLDLQELETLERAVGQVPLHELPSKLVPLVLALGSTVRQFRAKVLSAMVHHRGMDAVAFFDFFHTLSQMQAGLALTCADIYLVVPKLRDEA